MLKSEPLKHTMRATFELKFILTITLILMKCESSMMDANHASSDGSTKIGDNEATTEPYTKITESTKTETQSSESTTENFPRKDDIASNKNKHENREDKKDNVEEEKNTNTEKSEEKHENREHEKDNIQEEKNTKVSDETAINETKTSEEPSTTKAKTPLNTSEPPETTEKNKESKETTPTNPDSEKKSPHQSLTLALESLKKISDQIANSVSHITHPEAAKTAQTKQKRSSKHSESKSKPTNCSSTLPCPKKGYYRFNQSCTKYYQCSFSKKCNKLVSKIRTCRECLKFNAQNMTCDLPENVPECGYPQKSKQFCTGPGQFMVPDDCHKYYECTEKTNSTRIDLSIRTCPPLSAFSQKDKKCIQKKKCKSHVLKCAPGKFYLHDKFSCRKFYYCITNDLFTPLACPPGFVFDGKICASWAQSKLNWENGKKGK